jgi:hypothetical protein
MIDVTLVGRGLNNNSPQYKKKCDSCPEDEIEVQNVNAARAVLLEVAEMQAKALDAMRNGEVLEDVTALGNTAVKNEATVKEFKKAVNHRKNARNK